MDDLLIVMSNPRDGRHDAFNDWYTNVHIRDVMRLPGSSAVQRLRLTPESIAPGLGVMADRQFDYLAVYECYDIEQVSAGHGAVFSPMMLISDSFDFVMREAYYRPHVHRQKKGVLLHAGDYVIERIAGAAGDGLSAWYDRERMPALMALPGVVAGTFCAAADHQMLQPHEDSGFIGLYRTQDRQATLAAWGNAPPCPGDHVARVACYSPLIPRLTAEEVRNPSAEGRLAEACARLALGKGVYAGFPSELALS
ncbi:hypothetical protein VVT58_19150 (plasmid) [Sphingobium sp. SJ10-10]|uniref:hypothetical protein n=1 Tax=Sphingobium sp. SJ10-10 TaxID=3114999 RepID=UPI002E17CA0D|nr:hypothetical protein [Sphingobium sp. SJ10-10]